MSRDTLQNAKTELHALLSTSEFYPADELSAVGIKAVYPFEPKPGDPMKGIFVTVFTRGMEPTLWLYGVRVYATTDVSAQQAAEAIDDAMIAIDDLVYTDPGFGPSLWEGPEWVPELGCFVATNLLSCPRADF